MNPAVRYLQTMFEAEEVASLSDGQLLERFVAQHERVCLEALVVRHGPMVWGVCRRLLRDQHDAEDAFQVTFLVLARKAASVMPREKIGNWIYGVAYQTAMKARATKFKRQTRESTIAETHEPEAESAGQRSDLAELLDHELSRLPDKYRIPVVLCELEGRSHGEAAEHLGWPIGTVSGRLSRAKAMLAKRLTRQGVAIATGSAAMLVGEDLARASVSNPLIASTVHAASLVADGQTIAGVVSPHAAALTREVINSMWFSKVRYTTVLAAAAVVAMTLAGAGLWQARTLADGDAQASGTFQVTVNEVINTNNAVVVQIGIDAPTGSVIEIFVEKDRRAGNDLSVEFGEPKQAGRLPHLDLVILADQVELKEGGPSSVKLLWAYKVVGISSTASRMEPIQGDKQLSDVLSVPLKSGEFKFGESTKVLTLNGKSYVLLVKRRK